LARQLPDGRSLTEVRITAEGRAILVYDEGTAWNPESGQVHIDFTKVEGASTSPPPAQCFSASAGEQPGADELLELALRLEPSSPGEAYRAYTRVLAVDPEHAEAHVNAGRLLQLAGRIPEAISHYRSALRARTTDPTAAFNLGTALEEQGRWAQALAAYHHAVGMDPDFADAHFNLARLYDQVGRRPEAIQHLKIYKRLVH
jgi:tetratricopeptide (TPR) repeat protein